MADISKCNDSFCPSKNKCYRYTAKAGLYQSYANFNRESDADNCEYFWRLDIEEIEVTFEDVTTD